MTLITFKWFNLSCLYQSRPTLENRNHCKSFSIGNLIQRIWLHRWRSCWEAKWNSEATQRLVEARGHYYSWARATKEMVFFWAGNLDCPEELGWWSQGYLSEAGAMEEIQSMLGGRVRKGGHLNFSPSLCSKSSFPLCPPKLFGNQLTREPGKYSTLGIEQRRDLRANVLDQHTASA